MCSRTFSRDTFFLARQSATGSRQVIFTCKVQKDSCLTMIARKRDTFWHVYLFKNQRTHMFMDLPGFGRAWCRVVAFI